MMLNTPAHTADDTALLTVMDVVSADDVAADLLLQPSMILAAAYGVALHLGRALDLLISKVVVVVRVAGICRRRYRHIYCCEMSQSSMIQPLLQCGPIMPS